MVKTKLLKKAVAIVGPTAAGKTGLGVYIAEKFGGEIVSADSRQIYRHLDLSTGKDKKDYVTKTKGEKIPYHLIDILEPNEEFSSAEFQEKAFLAIDDILQRKRLPLVVGGSPFYVYSVTEGWQFPKIKKDEKLRKKLEKMDLEDLKSLLVKIDPKAYEKIDQKNPRRLQRAIEICVLSGKSFEEAKPQSDPKYDFLFLGVTFPFPELKQRIEKRLKERIKEGMIEEVATILESQKASPEDLFKMGLEPRFITYYLKKKINKKELEELLIKNILSFARRQMNWFRKDERIKWVKNGREAEKIVNGFLN